MELFSNRLETAQDLFLFLESIGAEARERLVLEMHVDDNLVNEYINGQDHEITADATEIIDDGAVVRSFRISVTS